MKKKLVAVAVAAVLAAPLAAQAQTANVTLYGRVHLTLEYIDASGPGATTVSRLSDNSSRFGLRGTESLGGGLNVIFQIESPTPIDTGGGGGLANRDSFIGFQGGWGTVTFGRQLMPYDDPTGIFGNTQTLNTSIFSGAGIWANNGGFAKATGSFDARLSNVIKYSSPTIAGFNGKVALSLDTENGATDPMVWGAVGEYRNGPFRGSLAVEGNKDVRANGLDDWAFTAAASWNFGIVTLAGVYERLDYETPTGGLKRDFWGVNVTANLGPGVLQAAWYHANDGKGGGSRVGGFASGNNTSADQYFITYNYPLSKRTQVYVGYSGLDNESGAGYNYGANAHLAGTLGLKLNGFALGAYHNF